MLLFYFLQLNEKMAKSTIIIGSIVEILGAMQICIARTSIGNVSGWLAGWVGGYSCLSQPILYQND